MRLGERAGKRIRGVYEWKLSEKTKKANAALTGLGHTRRIIVGDTLLQNYTEDEIERLAATGVRRLVVVPLSFVSDHIETLYELDQLYAGLARRHGIEHYYRARAFNGDPEFAQVLHSILTETQTC